MRTTNTKDNEKFPHYDFFCFSSGDETDHTNQHESCQYPGEMLHFPSLLSVYFLSLKAFFFVPHIYPQHCLLTIADAHSGQEVVHFTKGIGRDSGNVCNESAIVSHHTFFILRPKSFNQRATVRVLTLLYTNMKVTINSGNALHICVIVSYRYEYCFRLNFPLYR